MSDRSDHMDCSGCRECNAPRTNIKEKQVVVMNGVRTWTYLRACPRCNASYRTAELPFEIVCDVLECD